MSIYTSITIKMACACCVGTVDQPLTLTGNSVKRTKEFKQSKWKQIVKDEVYVGPKCIALHEKMLDIYRLMKTAYIPDPIDHSQDKPSNEIVGEAAKDFTWGFMSRYCEQGYRSISSVSSHEMKFHEDVYKKPPHGSRKETQIHNSRMAKKGGRVTPECQLELT
jgi:hypothetical protein